MIVFASAVAGCRRSLQCWPRDGGFKCRPLGPGPHPRLTAAKKGDFPERPNLPLRLIPYWKQNPFSGSFCIGFKSTSQAHFWIGKCSAARLGLCTAAGFGAYMLG